jgi:hypothetical protein
MLVPGLRQSGTTQTVLRLAPALTLFGMAYLHVARRAELAHMGPPALPDSALLV